MSDRPFVGGADSPDYERGYEQIDWSANHPTVGEILRAKLGDTQFDPEFVEAIFSDDEPCDDCRCGPDGCGGSCDNG